MGHPCALPREEAHLGLVEVDAVRQDDVGPGQPGLGERGDVAHPRDLAHCAGLVGVLAGVGVEEVPVPPCEIHGACEQLTRARQHEAGRDRVPEAVPAGTVPARAQRLGFGQRRVPVLQ